MSETPVNRDGQYLLYKIVIVLSATCRNYTYLQPHTPGIHKTNGTAKDKAKHKG